MLINLLIPANIAFTHAHLHISIQTISCMRGLLFLYLVMARTQAEPYMLTPPSIYINVHMLVPTKIIRIEIC